ncbi:hypothetical protein AC579_9611 [Pseudocercospora musae]|uniref:Uncharacterized protein n=1 Tax=Pseudocercospora musae TaxID=113226 RepID=A0A139ITA2_9PEZI|nr:hypothetical protein AC579_9611 [Pseudocercospora musae]
MKLQGAGFDGWKDEFETTPTMGEQGRQDIEAAVEEVETGEMIRVRYHGFRERQAMVESIEFQIYKEDHEQEAQIPSVTVSLEADETRPQRSSGGRDYSIRRQSEQPGAGAVVDDPLLPHWHAAVYGRGRAGHIEPDGPGS